MTSAGVDHAAGRASPRGAGRGTRGQALIEMSMFLLFITLLLAGVADVGGLLDDHIAVVYAARQGARTGSVVGPITNADCPIIGAVYSALAGLPNLTLTRITIYKAGADGQPAVSGGQTSEDVYPGAVDCANNQIVAPGTTTPVSPTVDTWDPTNNPTARNATFPCEDSLGVRLDYTFQFRFNILGTTFSSYDEAVFPMDPSFNGAGCGATSS